MAILLCFILIISGGNCVFAEEYIDGGTNKDLTAPLIINTFTYINTYDGAVGTPMFFRIIPYSTDFYIIETTGTVDTEGELYDSGGNSLEVQDDVVGTNFQIHRELIGGETYYLRVTNYTMIEGDQTILRIAGDVVGQLSAPPTATVQEITGTLQVGRTLTGNYTYSDANGDLEGTSTYKWFRSDDAAGLNITEIAGATDDEYILQSTDEGKYISFEVTPVALTGIAQGTAVKSTWAGAVGPAEAAPTAIVQPITGPLQVGATLTGNYTYSDANGDLEGTSTYKWFRSDDAAGLNITEIAGATDDEYILQSTDEGKYISFEVTPVALTGIAQGTAVKSTWAGAVGPAEAAPTAIVQPITGTLQVGATLTGHYTYSDVNGDLEGTSTYKWYRADNSSGLNKTKITGANAKQYVLTSDDTGKYISFEVTPVAATGITPGTAVLSAWAGVVVPAEAAPTATVQAITGTLQVGATLTGHYTYSDVNGDVEGTSTYKWYRADNSSGLNKEEIAGANAKQYELTSDDIGKYISFEVTPAAATGITPGATVLSPWKGAVGPAEAAPIAAVQAITGTLQVGATLTGSYAYNDVNGDLEGTSTYKWYRADNSSGLNKTEITGANAKQYVLTSDDTGKYISFEVTPVAATGITPGTAVPSAWAGAVVPAEAAPTATGLSITGTLQVGASLSGHYTYSDVNGDLEGTSTYKWYRSDDAAGTNKVEIAGATATTYLLVTEDAGKYISFEVTPVAATGAKQGIAYESSKIGAVGLTNADPPVIIEQPQSQSVNVGETAWISINATGSGTLSYQWYSNSEPSTSNGVELQTTSGSAITTTGAAIQVPTNLSGTTYYYCIVTNTDNTKTGSKTATTVSDIVSVAVNALTDAPAPVIVEQPQNRTVNIGGTVQLSVAATGSGVLSYQWYSNTVASASGGTLIQNSSGSAIQISANAARTTYYYCVITNTDNTKTGTKTASITSNLAWVTVNTPNPPAPPTPSTPSSSSSSSSSTPSVTREENNKVEGSVNGKPFVIGTTETTKRGAETVTTVSVDSQAINQILGSEGNNTVITIPVGKADVGAGVLTGDLVKSMENHQAVIEIKTDNVTYTLPAKNINIEAIAQQIGSAVQLKDIKVEIEISKVSLEYVKVIEDTGAKGGYTLVVPPVEFNIKCTANNQTVTVSKFNEYVERTIALPANVDPNKITTGVVVNPDRTVRHVPTTIIKENGRYYAKINSLTNSTYTVIYHPVEFADVNYRQWVKDAANDMGSRMIISGSADNLFDPDKEITRAEFAEIIVKALGLKPYSGKSVFSDVKEDHLRFGYIMAAYEYGLITGKGNNRFAPDEKITREQALAIISKAMSLTGLSYEMDEQDTKEILASYKDSKNISSWARESVALCLKLEITSGKGNGLISPKTNITRAEIAVFMQKLLKKSNLI